MIGKDSSLEDLLSSIVQPESITDSETILKLLYTILCTKYKNTDYVPDYLRDREEKTLRESPAGTENRDAFINILLGAAVKPEPKHSQPAIVKTTRNVY